MFFMKIFVDEPNIISAQLVDEMFWGEEDEPLSSFGVFEDLTSSLNITLFYTTININITDKIVFFNYVIKAEWWD